MYQIFSRPKNKNTFFFTFQITKSNLIMYVLQFLIFIAGKISQQAQER